MLQIKLANIEFLLKWPIFGTIYNIGVTKSSNCVELKASIFSAIQYINT